MVEGLDTSASLLSAHSRIRERSGRRWDGLSKREALSLARKQMRAKPDYRRRIEDTQWTEVDEDRDTDSNI